MDGPASDIGSWPRVNVENGKVVGLELEDQCLTGLPPEIGQLSNLVWFTLTDNQFTEIPQAVCDLGEVIKANGGF